MSITPLSSRVIILVKALPQPSKTYGETVCCAGVTENGEWKRLFPVRFRHLQGEKSFKRWDWVSFKFRSPTKDNRKESCHLYEDSIIVDGTLKKQERNGLLNRLLVDSAISAAERGQSLALIRPTNTVFRYKRKPEALVEKERERFRRAARQTSMLDKELDAMEPSPFRFNFQFQDQSGQHNYTCADWETHAMYFHGRREMGEEKCLEWMNQTFNEKYPRQGMAFSIGNIASRPQTWQLLGVLRMDHVKQDELPF
jgi:hypothetical protein